MLLEQLTELSIEDVLDRGVPNKECIAISVHSSLDISRYGILIGSTSNDGQFVIPNRDRFFWFGNGILNSGDWIFIYTGSGTPTIAPSTDGLSQLYALYWGRPMTLLYDSNTAPVLFRMDSIQIAPIAQALPQS